MTLKKITLFSNNIDLDTIFFIDILGLEKLETNKSYNKFIINDVIFSINNRQKGQKTNYFFEFNLNKSFYEEIKEKLNKLKTTFFININDNLIFSLNDFIFSLNFQESRIKDNYFDLKEISFVSTFDISQLEIYKDFIYILNDNDNDNFRIETKNLNICNAKNVEDINLYSLIKSNININLEISKSTPISVLINQLIEENQINENNTSLNLDLIFSGKSVVITKL